MLNVEEAWRNMRHAIFRKSRFLNHFQIRVAHDAPRGA
jgi:hypothetical protein